jgi:hypothetical protein
MGWPTGIKRLALAAAGAPLAAALTMVMLAGPAAAAPQPAKAALELRASDPVYSTLITGLRVRRAPSTAAPVLAVLGAAGTKVNVNCWARGTSVFGDSVWYHITAPHAGFVAGFYLSTGRDPAAGIPSCSAGHVFITLITGLRVRRAPSTAAAVLAVLGPVGTKVAVNCWARGTSVFGDSVWYHITAPHAGFVAGFYLSTGRDPAAGIPHC